MIRAPAQAWSIPRVLCSLILLCLSLRRAAAAELIEPTDPPPPDGWLTRGYDAASEWVYDAADWMDDNVVSLLTPPRERRDPTFDTFFGNREVEADENRSSVRIRPGLAVKDGESVDPDVRFRARIHLPRSERRVNLIIENFEEDDNVLEDFRVSRFDQTLREQETERAIRIQADLRKTERLRLSLGTGLSFRPEPVPKIELRLRASSDRPPYAARIIPAGFWDGDDGFGLKGRLEFDHKTSESWMYRFATSTLWSESSEGVDAGQTFALFYRPSRRRAYSFSAGVSGKVEPYQDIDLVDVRLGSRRLIHSNWIYLELEPGIQFPRERNWKETPFFNIELEFILGNTP